MKSSALLEHPTRLTRPCRLREGDTVGILSPGRWADEVQLFDVLSKFESLGFRTKVYVQNFARHNQFAGDQAARVKSIHDAFVDTDVRAIMLSKSGYGTLHLVDCLDYSLIGKNPKIFVGYSDATALLVAIYQGCGLVTFHGPMLYDLREGIDSETWTSFRDLLMGAHTLELSATTHRQIRIVREGCGTGTLLGGNLTLLANLIGTSTDFATAGRILFIEDVDEKLYSIDRLLLHLRRAGKFDEIAGLVIGEMHKIGDDVVPFGKTVDQLVLQHTSSMSFPIISNVPFGHGAKQLLMPIGIEAHLEADPVGFEFRTLAPAVE